jgi:paraquat-inducible protein B
VDQALTFINLLYNPERFVLRYDTNFWVWEPQISVAEKLGRLTPK